jgi:serine/threonine protein kinase
MALAPGTKLGPYEIQSPLGAGGMGEVYRARDPRLGRDVAIKVLPASLSADPGRLQRFEQEARSASALNHPNILVVYDIGTHNGAPYLVTELLEGQTLRERLHDGVLPPRKSLEYAIQVSQGLAAAHEKGIVYRDLKPDNIFRRTDVQDSHFGLANWSRQVRRCHQTHLNSRAPKSVVMGTAGYMSPEQVRHKGDARSDIPRCSPYEMLSGVGI